MVSHEVREHAQKKRSLGCAFLGDWLFAYPTALDGAPLSELRMALNQAQPIGNDRIDAEIHAMTGQKRELRKRGRPKKAAPEADNPENQMQVPPGN